MSEHPYRFLAGGMAAGALVGFAMCRFALPDHVVTKTVQERVEVESSSQRATIESLKTELAEAKSHTHTVVLYRKDGTKAREVTDNTTESNRKTTDAAKTDEAKTSVKAATEKVATEKEVTRERPSWRVGPMVGFDLRTGALAYGGSVERRILGPVSVGAFGLSSGVFGLSLTLEF